MTEAVPVDVGVPEVVLVTVDEEEADDVADEVTVLAALADPVDELVGLAELLDVSVLEELEVRVAVSLIVDVSVLDRV